MLQLEALEGVHTAELAALGEARITAARRQERQRAAEEARLAAELAAVQLHRS